MPSEPKGTGARALTGLGRHYLRGLLSILLAVLIIRAVVAIWPAEAAADFWAWLSGGIDRWALVVAGLLILPPLFGWTVRSLLHPILSRRRDLSGFFAFEDQLVTELAPDSDRGFRIVVVDHPTAEIATMGILTSTTTHPYRDEEVAAVFLPRAPDFTQGSIRVIPREKLHFTDWTLRDLWSFQLSWGSAVPAANAANAERET